MFLSVRPERFEKDAGIVIFIFIDEKKMSNSEGLRSKYFAAQHPSKLRFEKQKTRIKTQVNLDFYSGFLFYS